MQTASFDLEEATGSAQQVSLSIDFGWLGAEKASFGDVLTSVLSKLPDASDVLASMLSKLLDASDVLASMLSKLLDASDVLASLLSKLLDASDV